MKANENNFLTLLKERREEGILYVIDAYGGLLQSIVRKRLYAFPDRVDECMNDIFLGIWRNIGSFDESKGSFVNWAAGVARLEAIDMLRKVKRQWHTVPLDEMESELSWEDKELLKLTEQELSKEVDEILNCLSLKDRELFRRIFLNQEAPEEAGRAMGISRDNVYVRMFRGKKKIRSRIKEKKEADT